MAYYDKIAKQWHAATGYKGGVFKEHVLNSVLLGKLDTIQDRSILELGAGNGYFMPLVYRHFSGQVPSSLIVTDLSIELLKIAHRDFAISNAQYKLLNVCNKFPFEDNCFDIIIASMVFNEIPPKGFWNALQECNRILTKNGRLLIAITHPDFIDSLQKRGLLQRTTKNILTMPGTGSLRLPVIVRPIKVYRDSLKDYGFRFDEEEVYPDEKVIHEKSGLRYARNVPLAAVFTCFKSAKS
jgi:ubiquinone/menaquinone biosynthesis C-methylase UbiE